MATISNTSFFSPTQISGCALWLDAADSNSITQSGGNVSAWRDKTSAYVGTAVPTTTIQYVSNTLNGLPVIRIATAAYFTFGNINDISTEEFNIFAVVNTSSNTAIPGAIIGKGTGSTGWWFGSSGSTPLQTQYGGNNIYTNTASTNYRIVSSMNPRTSATTHYANGTSLGGVGNGTSSISNASDLRIGSQGNNYTINNTDFAEVILYRGPMTVAQRQQIEGYLAWKWGLQSNLPSSHPFYNYNPNVPNINLFTPTTVLTSPLQVSGCSLWLDAGDSNSIVRTGNTVTQWNNKVTGTTGAATINGTLTYGASSGPKSLPTMNTSAGGIYMAPLTPLTNSVHTTFFIMNMASTPGDGKPMISYAQSSGSLAMRPIDYAFNTFRNLVRYPTNASATAPSFLTTFFMGTSYLTTSVIGLLINGGQQSAITSITTNPATITGFGVGYSYENTADLFLGNISEVLTYSRALSTSEQQQVEGYLAWKWGLQSSLPTTHPFYNFNPSAPLLIQLATLPIVQSNTTLITMNPTQISGCALWLDAADANSIVLSGSNVSQWKDKSGNSRDTTATALTSTYNTNVLNGLNGIVITSNTPPAFTTSSNSPFVLSATSQISAFIILNFSSQTNYIDFMAAFPNRNNFMMGTDGAPIYPYNTYINNVNNYFSYNFPVNTTRIVELVYNGVSPALTSYINGSQIGVTTTPSPGTSLTTSQRIQVFNPNGVMTMTGQVFELLFYSRNLSTSERQQIEGYLAWKWGTQSNLPTTHPYFYNPLIPNLVLQSQLLSITPPSFSPLRFSGASLWLDAADPASVITSGSAVSLWNDKSGNGRHMSQGVASNQPTILSNARNSLPVIVLNTPTTNYMSTITTVPVNGLTGMSIFAVANAPANFAIGDTTANTLIWWPEIGGWGQIGVVFTQTAYGWRFGTAQGTNNPKVNFPTNIGTSYILTDVVKSGVTETPYYNGNNLGAVTVSNTTIANTGTTAFIGLGANGSLGRYNVGEIVVYSNALTTNQRQQIEGYLAWKWGLQSNLPANHPYVLFPPN